jgi:hypothetical protein
MQRHASIVFTLLGIVFLVLSVAAFFGLNDKVTLSAKEMRTFKGQDSDVEFRMPTFASVGTAPGFAVASGLCLIAAAVANRWGKSIAWNQRQAEALGNSSTTPNREADLWQPPEFPPDDF